MSPVEIAKSQSSVDSTLGTLLESIDRISRDTRNNILPAPNVLDTVRNKSQSSGTLTGAETRLNSTESIVASAFCKGEIQKDDPRMLLLKDKFSIVEQDFCKRSGIVIPLYGYDIFDGRFRSTGLTTGEINDDYIIGIGDTLVYTFVGSLSNTASVVVNTQGSVVLEKLPPIPAAGKTLGEFKKLLQDQINLYFGATESYVSIGRIREISVIVTGEVKTPGQHRVTALSSILDTIAVAGGVKKTGSLRRIKLKRNKKIIDIDLYNLIQGVSNLPKISMKEGDQIIVPTIGPVVGIVGDIKRPTLIELTSDDSSIDLDSLLTFGGREIRPRGNIYTLATFDEDGSQSVRSVDDDYNFMDGDLLVVSRGRESLVGGVLLTGHVSIPGRRVLSVNNTVSTLLGGDVSNLKKNPYLLFGVLETADSNTKTRRFYGLDLQRILGKQEDFRLIDGDNLIILSKKDIDFLSSDLVQAILINNKNSITLNNSDQNNNNELTASIQNTSVTSVAVLSDLANKVSSLTGSLGNTPDNQKQQVDKKAETGVRNCNSLIELSNLVKDFGAKRFSNAIISTALTNKQTSLSNFSCPKVFEDNPGLLAYVLEYAVLVLGEVRDPGIYPITEVSMASLVSVAGGLTRDADLTRTEMSNFTAIGPANARQLLNLTNISLNDIFIKPADVIRFSSKPSLRGSGPVVVSGAVRQPGTYQIRSGERVSELLQRAGGLTDLAYPYGAVFLRESIAKAEKDALIRLTRELNTALVAAATNRRVDADSIAALSGLARTLNTAPATGRMVIEADPTVLISKPELDVILEPGDLLFIPRRPSSVLVTGDVLNPGAMQFFPGKSVGEYVNSAGGYQRSADRNKVFVVLPNGSAQPAGNFFFQYAEAQVPPGSTVVVPKDATPFDAFNLTREVSQVFSQLAVAAAALKVIAGN
ncbi:MAG: Polysialic acid transport protein KpsD [Alphaproteobacteria bacterium MarineAlpha2_Bin1]|nr:MAG: Polysialic acid transport protein KpsD [Alphaproteobacteria bacterium MarineAlpha2_Bin1]